MITSTAETVCTPPPPREARESPESQIQQEGLGDSRLASFTDKATEAQRGGSGLHPTRTQVLEKDRLVCGARARSKSKITDGSSFPSEL